MGGLRYLLACLVMAELAFACVSGRTVPRSLELAQRHRMLQQDNDDFNFRQPVDPLTGDDDYSDGGGPGFRGQGRGRRGDRGLLMDRRKLEAADGLATGLLTTTLTTATDTGTDTHTATGIIHTGTA